MNKEELKERLINVLAEELERDTLIDAILGNPNNGEDWSMNVKSRLRANRNAWLMLGFSKEEINEMLDLLKEKLSEKEALGA